jgi:hypothetical protein
VSDFGNPLDKGTDSLWLTKQVKETVLPPWGQEMLMKSTQEVIKSQGLQGSYVIPNIVTKTKVIQGM